MHVNIDQIDIYKYASSCRRQDRIIRYRLLGHNDEQWLLVVLAAVLPLQAACTCISNWKKRTERTIRPTNASVGACCGGKMWLYRWLTRPSSASMSAVGDRIACSQLQPFQASASAMHLQHTGEQLRPVSVY